MKILNDNTCNLNWIKYNSFWILLLNSNTLNKFKFHWIQNYLYWIYINFFSYSFEKKWDVNWCKRHWISFHDYGAERIYILKRHIYEKKHHSFYIVGSSWNKIIFFSLLWNNNIFKIYSRYIFYYIKYIFIINYN